MRYYYIIKHRLLLLFGFTLINTRSSNCQPIVHRIGFNQWYAAGCPKVKRKFYKHCPYSMDDSHWRIL